jgi:enoyl-CoA hydratase/carnithine racemase
MPMQFWSTERRGAVEIATYSNPPHNYLGQPVIDELGQLVTDWQDPDIRAVVLQSKPQGTAGFAQYSVEELYGMASDLHCLAMRALSYVVTRQSSIG